MSKILQEGIFKGIEYQLKFEDTYSLQDDTYKIILIDTFEDEEIGHITFRYETFADDYKYEDNVIDVVDEYMPMCLEYLYINEDYRLLGFGKFLLAYFVNMIIVDKPCILLKASYGIPSYLQEKMDNEILPKFYESFGFKKLKGTGNYYAININYGN